MPLATDSEMVKRLFAAAPAPLLVLAPDAPRFTVVEVNDAYLSTTMATREGIVGRGLFEVFPASPDDAEATGVGNLRTSLERALSSGCTKASSPNRSAQISTSSGIPIR